MKATNFEIDFTLPVVAGSPSLTLGEAERVNNTELILPATVKADAVPGMYPISVARVPLPGPKASGPIEAVAGLVEVTRGTSTPAANAPPKAMLFWRLPVVHAAGIEAAAGQPAASTIVAIRFENERHGAALSPDGEEFETRDNRTWIGRLGQRTGIANGCLFADLNSVRDGRSPFMPMQCADNGTYFDVQNDVIDRVIFTSSGAPVADAAAVPLKGASYSALFMWDLENGFVTTSAGQLFQRVGARWTEKPHLPTRINSLFFQSDRLHGWAAGRLGSILSTDDGGEHWKARTAIDAKPVPPGYTAGPAPWYLTTLLISALLLGIVLVPEKQTEVPPAIEVIAASDRPLEDESDPDPLSFRPVARSLAYFIRNRRTTPPLNFAITGPWGTGKTSLMRLLRTELKKHGFQPVWFNAWHHQKEKYLLPSLLETIRQEAVPRLWDRGGIAFRMRLLLSRSQWWFAILALAFIGSFAVSAALAYQPAAASAASPAGSFSDFLKHFGPHGTAVVTGVTLIATLRKWLSAFGVEPAALLTSSGAGARASDLEKQTSFRYRFAKEFSQVTKALGPRQMVIFIDDLDRCLPQNTLDVLEAVNFLSSSGQCFVVMGMAKELVEEYVARSLDTVARALGASRGNTSAETPQSLAREYLQKLINIEVPVPATDVKQMRDLIASMPDAARRHDLSTAARALSTARAAALIVVPLLAAVFLGWSGFDTGKAVMSSLQKISSSAGGTTSGPGGPFDTGMVTPAPAPSAPASPLVGPADEGPETGAVGRPPTPPAWPLGWPALLILPLMIWALYRVATWRPDLEPDDSSEFTSAMDAVLPLILSRTPTPRSVKRFVNRVRYIAMRIRQRQSDDRPLWRRLLSPTPPETQKPPSIPDGILVALAALDYWKPSSLDTDADLTQAVSEWAELASFDPAAMSQCRTNYLRYASGVNVN
ncbi:MAG TPA: P-loop NTPase fold protein [Bryobacteraceae bacterium]|nr:P-loop NTPase fold protein [Bryobacteraceae bacterium]